MENPITRYLQDAIAAEKSFETQLIGFAKEASLQAGRELFWQHADETKKQYEELTSRLEALGGSTSTLKSFLAHMFGLAPKTAQMGHSTEERTTQDLIMAFAVENAEVAMYESLSVSSEALGDSETAALAKKIQAQEQATADKVWALIPEAAKSAFQLASESGRELLIAYVQDTEAAERNFEDALASFSKMGDQNEVQSLMSMMSGKARTQHERLAARLASLGGSTSTGKSFLAHLLAFTPVTAQLTHDASEKSAQHLMITYAAAAAEMGMYEALATVAQLANDGETLSLARQLQSEEKEDHVLAWEALGRSVRTAAQSVTSNS